MLKNKFNLQKPDFNQLREMGYFPIDMHVHTIYSSDGSATVKDCLKQAKKLGIGLAITDHNKIRGALEATKNNLGVFIIPGIEITHHHGNKRHYLLYFKDTKSLSAFYKKQMASGMVEPSESQLINLKQKYDYLIAVAHPNGWLPWHNLPLDFDINHLNALEIINANGGEIRHSRKSYQWAKEHQKGYTGGSDAHMVNEIGRAVTCFRNSKIDKMFEAIKNRQTSVVGKNYSFINRQWPRLWLWPYRRIKSSFSVLLASH